MATNTPLTGINKSLSIHNNNLDNVITLFMNYDVTAVKSIKELSDKFSELYSQLFSETAKLQDIIESETSNAAVAFSAGNAAAGAKILLMIKKYIDYITTAIELITLISKIVAKYIILIGLIAVRISETVLAGIKLGIKDGVNAATEYLSSLSGTLTDLIDELKKKAISSSKNSARETLINKWIKERDLLITSISSPNIVSQSVKDDILLKVDILNRNIRQVNKDLV